MILFQLALLVMRFVSDMPDGAGDNPEEKPPDFDSKTRQRHATAFYWEMYGATAKARNT